MTRLGTTARLIRWTATAATLLFGIYSTTRAAEPGPIPDQLRTEWKLDPFYQRYVDADGLLVVGSARVSDHALAEAAWVVGHMLGGRPDVRKAMRGNRVRVVVMAANEYTTDVPEHRNMNPKLYWDRRARGLGATLSNPVVSCGEENLLGFPGDPYPQENILVHEFAHAIHGTGLSTTDPTFDRRLRAAYKAAVERGLWTNTYAATNSAEYWAEGVQCWFDDNAPADALHNAVRTRAALRPYDPGLAELCREVFGDGAWRYKRPADRTPDDRRHLPGFDPARLARFGWRDVPIGDTPRVTIQTSAGDFDVELDARAAPEAAAQFLKIALDGGYHSGRFRKAVHDPTTPGRGAVTAEVNPHWLEHDGKRLKRDAVPGTKERPADGTIAWVRGGVAWGAVTVYAGPPAEPVGDVVPFGRVVKGREVVRKILSGSIAGDGLKPPVDIRRVIRTE